MSQEKSAPTFDVFIEVEVIPAVLINRSEHKERDVKELLGCFTVTEALRDQGHKVFPEIPCKIARGRY